MSSNANEQYPDLGPAQSGDAGSPARNPSNGMAIASMVLGIVGIVGSLIITYLGIILGVIALVLGIVARSKGEAVPGHGRGLIITGIVLGALAIVVSVVTIIVRVAMFTS